MRDPQELIDLAIQARAHAYAPYSGFAVGAALRATSGAVFSGANVENASFGLTICAERSAVVRAIAAAEQSFDAIAVVADTPGVVTPCGACRQVLAEFATPGFVVVLANVAGAAETVPLAELLPRSFGRDSFGTLADGA